MRALSVAGALPVLLPMVSFAPPDDSAPLDEALRNVGNFDWVFLTSQNAVRALEARCAALQVSLKDTLAGVAIGAVGPATAEAARTSGLEISYVAKKHQGVALAEELGARLEGKRILLPRSDRANSDIVEVLERLKARVTEVIAYKTNRPSADENRVFLTKLEQGTDAILFFSPSAVHNLQDMTGPARFLILSRTVLFAAIGPVTERTLRAKGVERILASPDTNVDILLQSLAAHFAMAGEHLPAGAKHA